MTIAIVALATTSSLANAATAPLTVSATTATTCTTVQVQTHATSLIAAANKEARKPLYSSIFSGCGNASAVALMNNVKAGTTPAQSKTILEEILAYLRGQKGTEDTIAQLVDGNGDLLALAGSDVEPAGGPDDGANQDFGTNDDGTLENPAQVSGNQPAAKPPEQPPVLQ
ncbi:MAG: hypothetical protein WAZ18_02725 [Alphaproteobacteria bacterium]